MRVLKSKGTMYSTSFTGAISNAEPDRREILRETDTQEKTLDAIGDALDDMKRMGQVNDFYCTQNFCLYLC